MRGILGAFIKILEKRHFVLSHYSVILGGESFIFYVLGSRVETFADRANTALAVAGNRIIVATSMRSSKWQR